MTLLAIMSVTQALILWYWDELTEAAQYVYSYITAYHYYGLYMLDDFVRSTWQ